MKRQSLWRVSVATTPDAEDAVSELLGAVLGQPVSSFFNLETGVSTVTVYCEQRPAAFHEPPGSAGVPPASREPKTGTRRRDAGAPRNSAPVHGPDASPRLEVKASQSVREKILAGLRQIKHCGLKTGSGKVKVAKVRREDWAESWKRHFKPIEIGDAMLVKPSWSKKMPRKNQAVVVLDPGLSFGTGQHPTTAFCLRALARHRKIGARSSFLDVGTGSGILAIAAAKLGYSPVCAFDFDPEAVRVARANARANGVHKKLRIVRADVTKLPVHPARQYDLICANLVSTLLISGRLRMVAQLNRGGTLVLAGILKSEFARVQKVFEGLGLKLAARKVENEWCSGSFCFAKISPKNIFEKFE